MITCEARSTSNIRCANTARYITEHGVMLCGLCDASQTLVASIRISDVPDIVKHLRELATGRIGTDEHLVTLGKLSSFVSKRGVTFP